MPLSLSFEEAINGLTTSITVNRSEQCSRCHGAGDTGGSVVTCSTCKGTGQVQRTGGRLRFSQECPDCGGSGKRRPPCSLCKGKGTLSKSENVKVRIPAGVDTGSRVRIPGKGEGGRLGAPPGDLYIITTSAGTNISPARATTFTLRFRSLCRKQRWREIEVPTVAGKAQLRISPGYSRQKFRLRGRGAPSCAMRLCTAINLSRCRCAAESISKRRKNFCASMRR
jgi:molecular chaperone DnaJ